MPKTLLCGAAAAAVIALAPIAPAGADAVIERSPASTPTDWKLTADQSVAQIEATRASGYRVIDIEVTKVAPLRFAATFVFRKVPFPNERSGTWYSAKTAEQVDQLTKGRSSRLVDLEPYFDTKSRLRFAFTTVVDAGPANVARWDWGHSLSATALRAEVKKKKLRVIDLNATRVGGLTLYSYVGIANTGTDAAETQLLLDRPFSAIGAAAAPKGFRVLDIEQIPGTTRWSAVLVKGSSFGLVRTNASLERIRQTAASNASRIVEVERTGSTYAALLVDDAEPETARMRAILRSTPYVDGYFGAYARELKDVAIPGLPDSPTAGKEYARLAARAPHQPMSVMKLVPHLYVMNRVDRGELDLDTTQITWKRPPGKADEPCEIAGSTATFSASLRSVLTRALAESLNRAHETLLDAYTAKAITTFARTSGGMTGTTMYDGCKKPGLKTWLDSRTTLVDLSRLFEAAETRTVFPRTGEDAERSFYSLIAGNGNVTDRLRTIVTEEATRLGVPEIADTFSFSLDVRGKGGGVDGYTVSGRAKLGRAYTYRARLLHKTSVGVLARPVVGGFFVNDLEGPCTEADFARNPGAATPACATFAKAMGEAFVRVSAEVLREPIRDALKTWVP